METYGTWLRLFELQRYYSWIIDRFHLSTQVYQMTHRGKDYDFAWLEDRLQPLGFHIILCTRATESMAEAREQRLKVSGNPSQYGNLRHFVEEQTLFRKMVRHSKLPWIEIDVSDSNVSRAVDSIADWMSSVGGLWAKEEAATP